MIKFIANIPKHEIINGMWQVRRQNGPRKTIDYKWSAITRYYISKSPFRPQQREKIVWVLLFYGTPGLVFVLSYCRARAIEICTESKLNTVIFSFHIIISYILHARPNMLGVLGQTIIVGLLCLIVYEGVYSPTSSTYEHLKNFANTNFWDVHTYN